MPSSDELQRGRKRLPAVELRRGEERCTYWTVCRVIYGKRRCQAATGFDIDGVANAAGSVSGKTRTKVLAAIS